MDPTVRTRLSHRFGPLILATLVLGAGLGLTWTLWAGVQHDARRDLQAEFDFHARELVNGLALRMSNYIQVLRGAQGLFVGSEDVTRAEFAEYVRSQDLREQFPAIAGLGYMEVVDGADLARHEQRQRADQLPRYAVHPAGPRPQYAPVVFLEPDSAANRPVLGFDTLTEPVRRHAFEQARDSGQPAMTGPIELLQESGHPGPTGFLVLMPVYRQGMPHDSIAQRRAALRGVVYAPFRLGALVAGLGGTRGDAVALGVYDGEQADEGTRMFLHRAGEPRATGALHTEQVLALANHRWTLEITALPSFGADLRRDRGVPIVLVGGTATLALTWFMWMLARSRAAAAAALTSARALTRELEQGQRGLATLHDASQRAEAMLRSILDSTLDGVLVDNGTHRILTANQRFRELWSVPPEIVLADDDGPLIGHMAAQLVHPAPFLYSRGVHVDAERVHRELLRLKDGRYFEQFTRAVHLGSEPARLWTFRDITERKQSEQRERSHRRVLEMLARGAPLQSVLDAVVLGVEATNPGMLCSILMADAEGRHLRVVSAPSLPHFFNEAVDGIAIERELGSCGSAAATESRVVVENVATHPYWQNYRELAARAGVAACWSEPIRGAAGKVIGTFAIYHGEPHYPSAAHVVLIEQSAQLAGIAIDQARAAQALRAGEERFRSLYDHAPVALWEHDWSAVRSACELLHADGVNDLGRYLHSRPDEVRRLASLVRIVDLNSAALAQVGLGAKDLALLTLAQTYDDTSLASFTDAVLALFSGSVHFASEGSFVRLDGVVRQNEVTLLVMPGHPALDFLIVSTVDITERKRMDAELLMLATTDFLTGLPNRREFMTRLDDELARLQRGVDECAAVLMLDLDHFKTINDRFGHAAGDAVLRHLAELMRTGQRKIDLIGRVGGEEFAVLLPGTSAPAAAIYAERLRVRVADSPVMLADGTLVAVTVSIGIAAILPGDGAADAALIRADQALYGAKEAGRNRVVLAPVPAA